MQDCTLGLHDPLFAVSVQGVMDSNSVNVCERFPRGRPCYPYLVLVDKSVDMKSGTYVELSAMEWLPKG